LNERQPGDQGRRQQLIVIEVLAKAAGCAILSMLATMNIAAMTQRTIRKHQGFTRSFLIFSFWRMNFLSCEHLYKIFSFSKRKILFLNGQFIFRQTVQPLIRTWTWVYPCF